MEIFWRSPGQQALHWFASSPAPVRNMLGQNSRMNILRIAEWNVKTLVDGECSKRLERQTALVAK